MTVNTSSVAKRGIDLLRDAQRNKSTAFTDRWFEALAGACRSVAPRALTHRRDAAPSD